MMDFGVNLGTIIEGLVLAALIWQAKEMRSVDRRLLVLETRLNSKRGSDHEKLA